MNQSRRLQAGMWVALAALLIVVQIFVGAPNKSMFWTTVFDTGHTPLFGLITVALFYGARLLLRPLGLSRPLCYGAAFVIALGLAGATEALQFFGPRDADPRDFMRNLLGITAALLILYAFDWNAPPRLLGSPRKRFTISKALLARAALVILAIALVVYAFIPLGRLIPMYLERNAAFPSLCEFGGGWESAFVHGRDTKIEIRPAPQGWLLAAPERSPADLVGHLTYRPADYPALQLKEPFPDWTGYDRLVFEAYSERPNPVRLILRIDDSQWALDHLDAFNQVLTIEPGAQQFSIPLSDVQHGPRDRQLNMASIYNLILFANRPQESFSIYVDSFRLESN